MRGRLALSVERLGSLLVQLEQRGKIASSPPQGSVSPMLKPWRGSQGALMAAKVERLETTDSPSADPSTSHSLRLQDALPESAAALPALARRGGPPGKTQ